MKWRESGLVARRPTYSDLSRRALLIGLVVRHSVTVLVVATFCLEPTASTEGWAVTSVFAGWAIARLCTRSLATVWAVIDVAMAALYLVATPWLVSDLSFVTGASTMLAVAGTTVISFGLAYPVSVSVWVALFVVGAWAAGAALVPGVGNPAKIFSLDFVLVEWALVVMVRRLIVRAADLTDGMLASAAEADVARDVAAIRRRHQRMQCAVMHDTAASTLLMVGQGAVRNRVLLRQQVRRDLDAIDTFTRPRGAATDSMDVVAALQNLCKHTQTPTVVSGASTLVVAREAGEAVVAAAGQALSNVDRHAQAHGVRIAVAADAVTISDDGIGFDARGDRVRSRHGVRNSILRRLEDVGGRAVVESVSGTGTTVRLSLVGVADAQADTLASDAASAERLVRGFGYGLIAIALANIALQSPRAVAVQDVHPDAQLVIIMLALACAVLAGIGVRYSVRAEIRWAATGTIIGLVIVQQQLLPVAELVTGANWATGVLGWVTVALLYRFPLPQAALALALQWGVAAAVLLVRSPDKVTITTLCYNIAGVAMIQALALVFTVLLVGAVSTAYAVNQQYVRQSATEAGERAVMEDVQARYRALSLTLVPLLEQLGDPGTDPADSRIRAAALIEGARLRRLFTQSDRNDHAVLQELQPLIAQAEGRGVSVHVDTATALPDMSGELRDRLLLAPSMLLSGAVSRARIVLTAGADAITVSVVCDCDEPTRTAAENTLGVTPAVVGELTWIELDHPLPRYSGGQHEPGPCPAAGPNRCDRRPRHHSRRNQWVVRDCRTADHDRRQFHLARGIRARTAATRRRRARPPIRPEATRPIHGSTAFRSRLPRHRVLSAHCDRSGAGMSRSRRGHLSVEIGRPRTPHRCHTRCLHGSTLSRSHHGKSDEERSGVQQADVVGPRTRGAAVLVSDRDERPCRQTPLHHGRHCGHAPRTHPPQVRRCWSRSENEGRTPGPRNPGRPHHRRRVVTR